MDLDAIGRKAGDSHRRALRESLRLGRDPNVTPIGAHVRCAIHRFHGSVCQIGNLVCGFELPRRPGPCFIEVAFVARYNARLLGGFGHLLPNAFRSQSGQRTVVPFHIQRFQSLRCGPETICNDGNAGSLCFGGCHKAVW